jgi:hypothetical protein
MRIVRDGGLAAVIEVAVLVVTASKRFDLGTMPCKTGIRRGRVLFKGWTVADNDGGSDGLDVSSALEALRAELEQAWRSGQGHQVQFGVDEISLTLSVVASGKKGARARSAGTWSRREAM